MSKHKIILSISVVLISFLIVGKLSIKKTVLEVEETRKPASVSAQSVSDSRQYSQKIEYPASVVGDQEIQITAKSAGTVTIAPGNIGESISAGALLAKIDDTTTLDFGEAGLRSLQVQQAENSVDQAKKAYNLAKDLYEKLKKSDTATGAEIDSAKTQRDIAKLQYENAKLGLTGSVDNHLITSPISGIITNKAVSVGDSVSVGQPLATVSRSSKIKVRFYVDLDQRNKLIRGQEISATDADGNLLPLLIQNISAVADQTTKRFLIEAYPKRQTAPTLLSGTIVRVSITKILKPQNGDNFLLPLSAINIGQNESHIFVIDSENLSRKVAVNIVNVNGEIAEIKTDLPEDSLIITNGNKSIHDGETVSVKN